MYSIDVYQYIASNEPKRSEQLIKSFGYNCRKKDMAQNLRELVAYEGEKAVESMMKIHPDYDYFMDISSSNFSGSIHKDYELDKFAYLNATGAQNQNMIMQNNTIANLTNVSIIVAGLLLATAIISKK